MFGDEMPNKKKTKIKKQVKPEAEQFLEKIKPLKLAVTQDKHGLYTIKNGSKVLTYVMDTKYGMSFYHKVDGNWRAEKLKTKKELDAKVNDIRKTVENKTIIDASLTPFFKCAFEDCDYTTDSKSEMTEHITESH